MKGQTIILASPRQRVEARDLIKFAPDGAVCNIFKPKRTSDQNAKMWAMISDISRAKPEGRRWQAEVWKCAFMHALGHQCQFGEGLDDAGPFPIGFKTSALSKGEMADLITCIQEYGDRHNVQWSEPNPYGEMACI